MVHGLCLAVSEKHLKANTKLKMTTSGYRMEPGRLIRFDEYMDSLISENEGSLFAFRIIGPCLLWAAFYCCLSPIVWLIDKFGDMLESVPCVGGCLGILADILETLATNSDLHHQLLLWGGLWADGYGCRLGLLQATDWHPPPYPLNSYVCWCGLLYVHTTGSQQTIASKCTNVNGWCCRRASRAASSTTCGGGHATTDHFPGPMPWGVRCRLTDFGHNARWTTSFSNRSWRSFSWPNVPSAGIEMFQVSAGQRFRLILSFLCTLAAVQRPLWISNGVLLPWTWQCCISLDIHEKHISENLG